MAGACRRSSRMCGWWAAVLSHDVSGPRRSMYFRMHSPVCIATAHHAPIRVRPYAQNRYARPQNVRRPAPLRPKSPAAPCATTDAPSSPTQESPPPCMHAPKGSQGSSFATASHETHHSATIHTKPAMRKRTPHQFRKVLKGERQGKTIAMEANITSTQLVVSHLHAFHARLHRQHDAQSSTAGRVLSWHNYIPVD